MKTIRFFACFAVVLLCASIVAAQKKPTQSRFNAATPTKVARKIPDPHFTVMLDNARVRVSRVEIAPNSETATLSHPYDYLLVSIGAADLEAVGTSNRFPLTMKDGEIQVIPGGWSYRLVNKSGNPAHAVVVESRAAIRPDAPICGFAAEVCHQSNFAKDGAREYSQTTLFETLSMRLVKAEVSADTLLPRHEHSSDHLVLALTGMNLAADGETFTREAGSVFWHAGGFNTLKNVGTEPARFLLVELK